MEGLSWEPHKRPPAYLGSPEVRARVDAPVFAALRAIALPPGGRALAVGLPEDEILRLLDQGAHLAVVEPDPDRLHRLHLDVVARGFGQRISLHGRPYGEISFERSSFDVVYVLDDFNRYGHPVNVARKCIREIKMGGRLFAKITGSRGLGELARAEVLQGALCRLPGMRRAVRAWERRVVDAAAGSEAWALDADAFCAGLVDLVRFESSVKLHFAAPLVGAFVGKVPATLRGAALAWLDRAVVADERLGERLGPDHALTTLLVAVKDVGFGRVFHAEPRAL
jgi:hypothetical protein